MPKRSRRPKTSAETDDVYSQAFTVKDDAGLTELHVCVGAQNAERLEAGLRTGFEHFVARYMKRKDFSGRVIMVVLSEVTPSTPEVWETAARVESELKDWLASVRAVTVAGRPVRVAFEYSTPE